MCVPEEGSNMSIITSILFKVKIVLHFFFSFDWHRISEAFTPTIPKGAQALGKEFPSSAPWIIQVAIKFPQSDGHKGAVASLTQDVRVYGSPHS